MNIAGKDLITIEDLSNQEIEAVFSLADEMSASMGEQFGVCRGKIMASLFFEPSTRTRLSFEAAMNRLGGRVISVAEMSNTSLAKGESIADMARVVGSYADIIVIRHPWEGAARVVAQYAEVPVINAGDGGHEHPTQTLCDLFTLKKERNRLDGLKIALWGDLKYGRTVHSLACALARFGATIHFRPSPGFEMPEHVMRKLTTEYTGRLERYDGAREETSEGYFPLDAVYVTPSGPHQLANIPAVGIQIELEKGVDALYVTRLQRERLEPAAEGEEKAYPVWTGSSSKRRDLRRPLSCTRCPALMSSLMRSMPIRAACTSSRQHAACPSEWRSLRFFSVRRMPVCGKVKRWISRAGRNTPCTSATPALSAATAGA